MLESSKPKGPAFANAILKSATFNNFGNMLFIKWTYELCHGLHWRKKLWHNMVIVSN